MSDRRVISTTGRVAEEKAIQRFKTSLRGELIRPGDKGYESARRVWNWAIDRHPGLIVRCAEVTDVIRAVEFARSHDLLVAVRGGGHSYAGHSVCDGGMVIDLSRMKGIQIDPEKHVARAEAGLTVDEFDKATQAFGLTTSLGACTATGIAGLTLGGGLGWLTESTEPLAITSCRLKSSRRMAACSLLVLGRMKTCSGECEVGVGTSAWQRRSRIGSIP